MKRLDKAYVSAWVLLSVFIPMVLLSSLHIHPQLPSSSEPCYECLEHMVHNGHFTAAEKATVDCPLCAFQSNVFQGEEESTPCYCQDIIRLEIDCTVPSLSTGSGIIKQTRAPPFTFCA